MAQLQGKPSEGRSKPLFWKMAAKWPASKNSPYHWVSYCVVFENWKLLTNADSSYVELYDIVADAYEKVDLKEAKPEVVRELIDLLSQWKASLPPRSDAKNFSELRKR